MKFLLFFFFSFGVFAQVLNEAEVAPALDKLEKLAPEKFINEIAPVRESLQNYLLTKKRVCQGEFTERAINKTGDQKLNEKDKKMCFQELKDFEGSLIEALYLSRRRYLEYNHAKQLEELQRVRDHSVKDLKKKY